MNISCHNYSIVGIHHKGQEKPYLLNKYMHVKEFIQMKKSPVLVMQGLQGIDSNDILKPTPKGMLLETSS